MCLRLFGDEACPILFLSGNASKPDSGTRLISKRETTVSGHEIVVSNLEIIISNRETNGMKALQQESSRLLKVLSMASGEVDAK